MRSVGLYLITVLIWGSTWLAIEFQLGVVAPQVSLFYRFALAALVMWGFCLWRRTPMKFGLIDHSYFMILACCNFGFNYVLLYWAQAYLTSAMTSIAFSTLLLLNILNTRLFFGNPIAPRIYVGAITGLLGIACLFGQDLLSLDWTSGAMIGLGLSLAGTFIASLGNMASVRNSRKGVGILAGNAWGMLYGAAMLCVYTLFGDAPFAFDLSFAYISSLLYLSVFGTVIAFACYFLLLRDIGPERASYVIVLFPVVAVILSTLFEDFEWQLNTIMGFVLVLLGNALVLTPMDKIRQYRLRRAARPAC